MNMIGAIIRKSDMPDDLNASSSRFSARLPNVIKEASRTESGKASGTSVAVVYKRNSAITLNSSPFPISSSIYFQRNCIRSINTTKKKVRINGPTNDFITRRCNFFTSPNIYSYTINANKVKLFLERKILKPDCML